MKLRVSRTWLLVGGIMLFGLLLRVINIGTQPYWGDEVLSLDIARNFSSAHEMMRYLAEVEVHPPLYYLMLRPWTDAFGTAEAATRSLSLIFSLGTIVMTFLLGKRLFRSDRVGLVAAFMMAILPLQIQYAQEARPYAIYCFFTVVGAYAAWECCRGEKKDTPKYLALYAASSIIGIYLHYSYVLFLGAVSTWWLYEVARSPKQFRSRRFLIWLSVHAAIFVAFFPWLKAMLLKAVLSSVLIFGDARLSTNMRLPGLSFNVLDQLIWTVTLKYVPNLYEVIKFVACLAICVAAVVVARSPRASTGERDERGANLVFLAWLLGASMIAFFFSPQSSAYAPTFERHVIFVTVPLCILFAALAARLPKLQSAALVLLLASSLLPYVANIVEDDSQWDHFYQLSAAGTYINQNYKPGDLVIVSSGAYRTDLTHYLADDIPVVDMQPINYYGLDYWAGRHVLGFVENEEQSRGTGPSEAGINGKLNRLVQMYKPKRIWLYAFPASDTATRRWFHTDHWRYVFQAIGDVFQVDLFAAPTVAGGTAHLSAPPSASTVPARP